MATNCPSCEGFPDVEIPVVTGEKGDTGADGNDGAAGADGADGDDCDCCCEESVQQVNQYSINTAYEFVTDVTCNSDGTLSVTKQALSEAMSYDGSINVCPDSECP